FLPEVFYSNRFYFIRIDFLSFFCSNRRAIQPFSFKRWLYFLGVFCLEMRSFNILSSLVYKGDLVYFFSRLDLERSSKEEA
ncbi:hypothetical protein GIB67_026417, partial [Kingdonia uniflora]